MESDFETQAIATQLDLQKKINNQSVLNLSDIRYVAGIDLAYWKVNETEYAVCSIVVLDYNTHIIMEQKHKIGKNDVPYIPGCLSFRELPLILETIKAINKEPDVYLFDGNGYLHPRKMGIATHAGILLNKPSIGVAKSYYNFGNTTFTMPTNSVGSYTNIIINSELYGRVLRTKKDVKPVFISIGNNICLEESTELVMSLIDKESHYPLPIRYADIETRKLRKQYMEKNMY